MDKPYYPLTQIGSLNSLGLALGVVPKLLTDLIKDIPSNYTPFNIKSKSGKERDVFEPKYNLKVIQKRINKQILSRVNFPLYLQGGLKDEDNKRDYLSNATFHANSETLISLDIKDFYNSISEHQVEHIFKHFFKFPPDVSEVLTKLVTLEGRVPQGACTSSYIANLVFHDKEYLVVSKLRRKKISYSRLLDDVTLSSQKKIQDKDIENSITMVVDMFKSKSLRINNKKKRIEHKAFRNHDYTVTGLWVGHGVPKLRKAERRYIRQMVYECEKYYKKDKTDEQYHKLWNSTSGKVAKMSHLGHAQSEDYRKRLSLILPELSENNIEKLITQVKKFVDKIIKGKYKDIASATRRYNELSYQIGICSRSDIVISKSLRAQLKQVKHMVRKKSELWS